MVALATFFAPVMPSMIGDEASRAVLEQTMKSPAMLAMCGVTYGDEYTYGAAYAQYMLVWTVLVLGIMNIMLVVRHTRKDEEEGRLEMLVALPVGRIANLFAVLKVSFAANLAIALLTAVVIPLFGVESLDYPGSLAYGAVIGAAGFVFAAVTALFSQLANTSKGAYGLSFTVLGLSYLMRAAGDVDPQSEALALISPIGLAERAQSFVSNLVWPIAVLLLLGLVLFAGAIALNLVRDSGAGLLPARKGKAHASFALQSGFGLVWRLTRGTVLAWAIIIFSFAAAYGSVFGDLSAFYESNDLFRAMLSQGAEKATMIEPVVSMLIMILSIIAAVPVAMVVLRLKSEENHGRIEQVYAKAQSRVFMMTGYIAVSFVLAFILQLLCALGLWSAAQAVMEDPISLEMCLKTALNCTPAVVIFAGLCAFLVGVAPKLSPLVWVYLVFSFLMIYLGGLSDLPEWVKDLSPFGLLPSYPLEAFDPAVFIGLLGASVALAAVGLFAYRRRDIKA
jgi:ABC-2 type transport system permease protein